MSRNSVGRRGPVLLVGLVMGAALFAACGGDSASDTTESANVTRQVAVEVGETEDAMYMSVDPGSITSGEVTFHVTNTSELRDHEMIVIRTDLAPADLPYDTEEKKVLEDADGLTPVDEIEDLTPGSTGDLTVDLEPGHYILLCNIESHYALGTVTEFDVTG